jgi:hypothetical protein
LVAFLLAGAGVAATALLGALALRQGMLAAYALAAAEIVAASELLSLLHAIGVAGYAGFEAGAFVIALAAWYLTGMPRPVIVRPRIEPLAVALVLVVVCAVSYELFLVVATPPNNWDSMHYHLARAAAWKARGSLAYFPTHNGIENAYPQNSELLVLYTLVLAGRDVVAALPQLVAGLATALGIYRIGVLLGFRTRDALFAALLFPTLTIVALESVTTQNDLVEASFVVAGVAFALGRSRIDVSLAGLALGLAAGTKLTFLYAVPVLVLIGALLLPRRRAFAVLAASLASFALFGAYAYAQNLYETGRPQGRAPQIDALRPHVTAAGTISTIFRSGYRMIDLSGYHPPSGVSEHVAGAAKRVFAGLHIPANPPEATTRGTFPFSYELQSGVSEDASAFGPLGFALVIPLSLFYALLWAFRGTGRSRGVLALALPLYLVALALGTRWNPYVDRFLTTPVALTLPLAAPVVARIPLRAAALALGAATVALAHAYNPSKPTSGLPVWDRTRVQVQAIRWPELEPVLAAVQAQVPSHARLGIDLGARDWEYPLWGPRLQRRLVWLQWVVFGSHTPFARTPGWCARHFRATGWTLLRACGR